ncbi:MAG: hypothetical protein EP343_27170 [Deltaproteobacteria bacterium]|nr:MAG: hypothetical protein EP343_27170 [Deltaproteobacteria bacterium]
MNVSITTLARYLMEHVEDHHLIYKQVESFPGLALSFEALRTKDSIKDWVTWIEAAKEKVPTLVSTLVLDLETLGEETSMEVSPLRETTKMSPPPSPPTPSPLAWLNTPEKAPLTPQPIQTPPPSQREEEDDDELGEATMMESSLPSANKGPVTPSHLFSANPLKTEDPMAETSLELPLSPPPDPFSAPSPVEMDAPELPPEEEHPPTPKPKRTSDEQKEIAKHNTQLVYSGGLGWHRYQFDPDSGYILSETEEQPNCIWMHTRIEESDDGATIREMHLHVSEEKVLVYRNLLWYWQNPETKELTKTNIVSISDVLRDETVDLLLDLVSPGLFVQAADAQLSYSFSQAISPSGSTRKSQLEGELSPHQSQEISAPSLTSGENAIFSQSPFAVRPVSEEAGETTFTRRAVLEPLVTPPTPSQLTIQQELQPSWFSRMLRRFLPQPPVLETISELQVNETQEIQELGLSITFLIESTASSTFPWVRITRDNENSQDAIVSLQWNHDQTHKLPPNFKSTGALSRSPGLGQLTITFEQPGYQPLRLHIHWS